MTTPDIFLSYNREDSDTARRFAEGLEREGFSVWDQTLRSGEAYEEVTEAALKAAKAVVVLWSPRSVVSRWVRAEATIADRNKTLVPVMIEPCERPIMFELIMTAPLEHWQGDGRDAVWLAFVDDVRKFVDRLAAPSLPSTRPTASHAAADQIDHQGALASIAVLPLRNRSGRAEDEVIAEGMFEDLVEALSAAVNVTVVSASVVRHYVNHDKSDLAGLVQRSGVRYLLEGNVRRAGEQLRVTAQLIGAASGAVLWIGKFERPLAEIGQLQTDLVLDLAAHLDVQVYRLEMDRALKKPDNLTAWECVIRGMGAYTRRTPGKYLTDAIAEGEHAVALAPKFGMAHAMLASAKATAYMMASPDDPAKVAEIRQHITQALALDQDNALVLAHAGNAHCLIGEHAAGLVLAKRATGLRPELGFACYVYAFANAGCNLTDEAISQYHRFHQIEPESPMDNISYPRLGQALVRAGRWEEAIAAFDQGLRADHRIGYGYCQKAIIYAHLGDQTQARQMIDLTRDFEPAATRELWTLRFRRLYVNSPLQAEIISLFDALWSETEPGWTP